MLNVKKTKAVRIMVFGTFDGLHPGHLNFFKQARALKALALGQARNLTLRSFLIVSIARDKNAKKIKKTKPTRTEQERFKLVQQSRLADRVVLGGLRNHIPHIVEEQPDIIALGYDQRAYVAKLQKELKKKGLSVQIRRLQPYKEKIYKNRLLNR
ncbi:hypothetical protein A3G06_00140 [Candidatus Nomurabacteria bacterium RIFCSPLOWO2_12_FULL_46_14]|uniref:Cytidyltransferase-like domain-containing protein n=1 Tax=Candidatus Nomurabacteria bacterium RIFCSPLOWO2_12_FULL_46_14 TaxID=1801797 RepID=A0A1F6YC63_9BACT|nr:MAG: hypothetical protein A3G06_00140 [Candidatus Nomurabacteria bacterium RIFCSPLOWO2_12_FULL_46_14]